ncbi:uncharacterized protein BXZ73DRAFT_82654 [Epithele typhae]|uniref:uncharacterized protein n=1 Tax=Epithele typhae TaxID=378194 RepID=UPI0020086A99|nr:uncharacterized protein BXZ73DRAFT_82654 [Epithele typhae]KAH9911734.1 hypothetical protein BXZ73DRAFT_82654 [Epithele typhae]
MLSRAYLDAVKDAVHADLLASRMPLAPRRRRQPPRPASHPKPRESDIYDALKATQDSVLPPVPRPSVKATSATFSRPASPRSSNTPFLGFPLVRSSGTRTLPPARLPVAPSPVPSWGRLPLLSRAGAGGRAGGLGFEGLLEHEEPFPSGSGSSRATSRPPRPRSPAVRAPLPDSCKPRHTRTALRPLDSSSRALPTIVQLGGGVTRHRAPRKHGAASNSNNNTSSYAPW